MSNIEWTDATWNPVVGCTPVSPGCLNCYAATMARRIEAMGNKDYAPRPCVACGGTGAIEKGGVDQGCPECKQSKVIRIAEVKGGRAVFTGEVRCLPERLEEPLRWRKPRRVFVDSMSDLFHEAFHEAFEFIDRVMAVIALCPRHTFQVLTKRPERMTEYFSTPDRRRAIVDRMHEWNTAEKAPQAWRDASSLLHYGKTWPLPNLWLGTSVEDQARADERIPHLLRCPAAVRFLSCEPLLGAVDLRLSHELLTDLMDADPKRDRRHRGTYPIPGAPADARTRRRHALDWVIVGGESGPHARACNVEWIRSIVAQCKAAGVPCFVKQLGAAPFSDQCHPSMVNVSPKSRGWPVTDRKGGNPAEWPEDLRVREFPRG